MSNDRWSAEAVQQEVVKCFMCFWNENELLMNWGHNVGELEVSVGSDFGSWQLDRHEWKCPNEVHYLCSPYMLTIQNTKRCS